MNRKLYLTALMITAGAFGVSSQSDASIIVPSVESETTNSIAFVSVDPQKAEGFISSLTNDGIGFLKNDSLTPAQQAAAFSKLLSRNFDLDTIARFALGKYWRSASPAQQKEYTGLFKKMIVDVYSRRFGDYQGQEIKVVGSRKEGSRDVLVQSVLEQKSGPDVNVDWRVRERNGKLGVIDVMVEGVSLSLTQRSDFASVIQRGGGDVEALLVHLRK